MSRTPRFLFSALLALGLAASAPAHAAPGSAELVAMLKTIDDRK